MASEDREKRTRNLLSFLDLCCVLYPLISGANDFETILLSIKVPVHYVPYGKLALSPAPSNFHRLYSTDLQTALSGLWKVLAACTGLGEGWRQTIFMVKSGGNSSLTFFSCPVTTVSYLTL
jgi:hypothetical protein